MDYFWSSVGNESDLVAMLDAKAKADDMVARAGNDKPEFAPIFTKHGNVGVINIQGPLVAGDAGFMRLFGYTGYDNIREAMVAAVEDKQVKSILLNINSGGGSINGTSDTHAFIKSISALKPVTAYADNAASAAYWLGTAASHITAASTALVGSIGVLRVHTEYSKADAKEGVTRTILRSGEFKALVNAVEPLTDVAKAQTQVMLDDVYKSFATDVSIGRGVTYAVADQKMGQGREFMGNRALEAGLVDKVGTFEQALVHAASLVLNNNTANRNTSATNGVAKTTASVNNTDIPKQGSTVKPTLTETQLLAISAGINSENAAVEGEIEGSVKDVTETKTVPNIDAQLQLDTLSAELNMLKAELVTAKDQLTEAQAAVDSGKQAAIEASEATKALAAIVSASTKSMLIALGGKHAGLEALTPVELAAKHSEVATSFKEKIKAGGVAATSAKVEAQPVAKTAGNHLFAAFVQSSTKAK